MLIRDLRFFYFHLFVENGYRTASSYLNLSLSNNIANDAVRKPAQTIHSRNIVQFHDTNFNGVSFTAVKYYRFRSTNFHETHKCSTVLWPDILVKSYKSAMSVE
jgi:hypothetical protein